MCYLHDLLPTFVNSHIAVNSPSLLKTFQTSEVKTFQTSAKETKSCLSDRVILRSGQLLRANKHDFLVSTF